MMEKRRNQAEGCRVYKPTPRDVRQACKEIQATWSPRERTQRAMIRLSELAKAIGGKRADRPRYVVAGGNEAGR